MYSSYLSKTFLSISYKVSSLLLKETYLTFQGLGVTGVLKRYYNVVLPQLLMRLGRRFLLHFNTARVINRHAPIATKARAASLPWIYLCYDAYHTRKKFRTFNFQTLLSHFGQI